MPAAARDSGRHLQRARLRRTDGRHDPDRVASVITELDADIVALQEFTYPASVALETRQPVVLTTLDRYQCALGPTRQTVTQCFGNALLRGTRLSTCIVSTCPSNAASRAARWRRRSKSRGRRCTCSRPIWASRTGTAISGAADPRLSRLGARYAARRARRFQRLAAGPLGRARARPIVWGGRRVPHHFLFFGQSWLWIGFGFIRPRRYGGSLPTPHRPPESPRITFPWWRTSRSADRPWPRRASDGLVP